MQTICTWRATTLSVHPRKWCKLIKSVHMTNWSLCQECVITVIYQLFCNNSGNTAQKNGDRRKRTSDWAWTQDRSSTSTKGDGGRRIRDWDWWLIAEILRKSVQAWSLVLFPLSPFFWAVFPESLQSTSYTCLHRTSYNLSIVYTSWPVHHGIQMCIGLYTILNHKNIHA